MKSDIDELLILSAFALIIAACLFFCFVIYLAYFRLREILANLRLSPAVSNYDLPLGLSPFMRLVLLGSIGMMLTIPRRSIKNGLLSVDDYQQFPRRLKFLLRLCNCTAWLLSGVVLIAWWRLP